MTRIIVRTGPKQSPPTTVSIGLPSPWKESRESAWPLKQRRSAPAGLIKRCLDLAVQPPLHSNAVRQSVAHTPTFRPSI